MSESIIVPQTEDLPTSRVEYPEFLYRYAFARSQDGRESGDPGQDYLTIRANENQLVFALCDGVSQSFMGDMAARIVGRTLLSWFAKQDAAKANLADIESELKELLNNIAAAAQVQVDNYAIPEDAPIMLRDVLAKKQQAGSESMFCAGIVDLTSQRSILAWMGDIRLRMWDHSGERTTEFAGKFNKKERWSTKLGLVGELHVITTGLDKVQRILIYTDGLSHADAEMDVVVDDHTLTRYVREANGVDDIALLDVLFEMPEQPVYSPLLPPKSNLEVVDDRMKVAWPEMVAATEYQVAISWMLKNPSWSIPISSLSEPAESLLIRAWDGDEPGEWSEHDSDSIQSIIQKSSQLELIKEKDAKPEHTGRQTLGNKRRLSSAAALFGLLLFFGLGFIAGIFVSRYGNTVLENISPLFIADPSGVTPSITPTIRVTEPSKAYLETTSTMIPDPQNQFAVIPLPNMAISEPTIIYLPLLISQNSKSPYPSIFTSQFSSSLRPTAVFDPYPGVPETMPPRSRIYP